MNDDAKAEILAEIDELAGRPVLEPTDVTIDDLVRMWGIGRYAAEARMQHLVGAGTYVKIKVYNPTVQRSCTAYRKAEPGQEGR